MPTVYLHIGMPKTGTSYLQVFLRNNNKLIKKQGFVFPNFKIHFENIRDQRNAHFLAVNRIIFNKYYKKAVKRIEELSQKYDKIILTDEDLWNYNKNIPHFVKDMKSRNIDVKIVVYLRRQDLFLQSIWAQKVKRNMTLDFKNYIKVQKNHLDYYKQCCMLSDIVGEGNVIVRVYEKQQFGGVKNNLLTDFFDVVGLKYDEKFVVKQGLVNPSLTGIYLEIKRMLNKYPEFRNNGSIRDLKLYNIMKTRNNNSSYSSNVLLEYTEQIELLSKYEESNKNLAKEFLGREDGILFKDEIIENKCVKQNYDIKEYTDIFISIIKNQQLKIKKLKRKVENISKK